MQISFFPFFFHSSFLIALFRSNALCVCVALCLITFRATILTSDFITIGRQGTEFIFRGIDGIAYGHGHVTRQAVAVQFQDLQLTPIVELRRNGTGQIVIVQPATTHVNQLTHFGGQGSRQFGFGNGQRSQVRVQTDRRGDGSTNCIGIDPQGKDAGQITRPKDGIEVNGKGITSHVQVNERRQGQELRWQFPFNVIGFDF
mmetsp:Transcript_11556/g.22026  ORF Transcript_11556/g.22026 Transcript_11556/m.22026 type:complete len:201 (-) Transcript_11556:819-1421(-)